MWANKRCYFQETLLFFAAKLSQLKLKVRRSTSAAAAIVASARPLHDRSSIGTSSTDPEAAPGPPGRQHGDLCRPCAGAIPRPGPTKPTLPDALVLSAR